MSERGVGKPWTPYEDSLLTQAVALYGECDNWKNVALSVPGRTNKACRKRWLHSLSPSVKKTAWTPEEDQLLLSLYAVHGTKWALIARHIPGRTDDACSKRYREALDPSLKRDEWMPEEDARLEEAYTRLGGRWGQIGQELKRSGLGCRNRWRMLERKKATLARATTSNAAAPLGETQLPVAPEQPQWAPIAHPAPDQFWDHAIPQYAPSSVLENAHPGYEAHDVPFDPELLDPSLRVDADRTGYPNPPGPALFQYASSSLSAALENPQRSHPPSPPSYYSPPLSPESVSLNVDAVLSLPDIPPCERGGGAEAHAAAMRARVDAPPQDIVGSSAAGVHLDHSDDAGRLSAYVAAGPAVPPPQVCSVPRPPQPEHEDGYVAGAAVAQTYAHAPNQVSPYYRTEAQKAQNAASRHRRGERQGPPPRLSCNLPAASDPATLAYACGHGECWPPGEVSSSHRYATSKELLDHYKLEHADDMNCTTPFRCALANCERSWKSINGLQYHLQVSKVHFQQALESYTALPEGPDVTGAPEVIGIARRPKKVHPCPHPGCRKEYKQLSGLRYHLTHGHTQDQPAQLDVIPPGLARKLAEKV